MIRSMERPTAPAPRRSLLMTTFRHRWKGGEHEMVRRMEHRLTRRRNAQLAVL
jgi:hypothetical protein